MSESLITVLNHLPVLDPEYTIIDREYTLVGGEDDILPYGHDRLKLAGLDLDEDVSDLTELDSDTESDFQPDKMDLDVEEDAQLEQLQEVFKIWDVLNGDVLVELRKGDPTLEEVRNIIQSVFFPLLPWTLDRSAELTQALGRLVDALVYLRQIPEREYRQETWQTRLEQTGLLKQLNFLSHPRNLIEFSNNSLLLPSFRKHNWKLAFMLLLDRWLPPPAAYKEAVGLVDPGYAGFARDFLQFMSDHHELHTWSYNPMAVFMIMSLSAFQVNWRRWLGAHLVALNEKHKKFQDPHLWDPTRIYEHLMAFLVVPREDRLEGRSVSREEALSPDAAPFVAKLDARLRAVLQETAWQRNFLERTRADLMEKEHREPPRFVSSSSGSSLVPPTTTARKRSSESLHDRVAPSSSKLIKPSYFCSLDATTIAFSSSASTVSVALPFQH
ncbi:hypothetical protein HMN09_00260200 [Mycena chlorophos]|uniref:Uncharacterized protein n=1 Tax=Mycena chlorophos TaxID=658473 RepID=A0A8H6TI89_MYCCL|nr:hypothetical protein HMN09_00260200 [Mycena chlorophos]